MIDYDSRVARAVDTYCSQLMKDGKFFKDKHYYACTDEIATYVFFSFSPGRKVRKRIRDLGFTYRPTSYVSIKCWVGTDMRCFNIETYLSANTDIKVLN